MTVHGFKKASREISEKFLFYFIIKSKFIKREQLLVAMQQGQSKTWPLLEDEKPVIASEAWQSSFKVTKVWITSHSLVMMTKGGN